MCFVSGSTTQEANQNQALNVTFSSLQISLPSTSYDLSDNQSVHDFIDVSDEDGKFCEYIRASMTK